MNRRNAEAVALGQTAPVAVSYVPQAQLDGFLRQRRATLLAAIHYGEAEPAPPTGSYPAATVRMRQLGDGPRVELWTSAPPVEYRRVGRLQLAANPEVLFGCLAFAPGEAGRFESEVRERYDEILTLIAAEGYPHLLRMWNYFPGINDRLGTLDRYQCFCRGRYQALERRYGAAGQFEPILPSASAVGSAAGDFVLYFIAGREAGRPRENPRQVSAYHYPPQYGPRSPSFARATLKRWADADYLYISGTASIVGHESRHPEEPGVQLEETLRNLQALIETTAGEAGCRFRGLESITHLKVYVRDSACFAPIRERLDALFPPAVERLYLHAEICRPDLSLEIEAIARST
jgi:chorismate lyase/3-hydroxybenzoate synthase